MQIPETLNLDFIEEQYRRYKADPLSVPKDWQFFFQGFDLGLQKQAPPADIDAAGGQVGELIQRYHRPIE